MVGWLKLTSLTINRVRARSSCPRELRSEINKAIGWESQHGGMKTKFRLCCSASMALTAPTTKVYLDNTG